MIMAPIAKSAMPIGTTTPSPITMRVTVGSTNPWSVATMMIDALDRASALIGPLKIEPQNNPTPGQGGGTGRHMAVNRDGAGAIRRTARNDSRRLAGAFRGLAGISLAASIAARTSGYVALCAIAGCVLLSWAQRDRIRLKRSCSGSTTSNYKITV